MIDLSSVSIITHIRINDDRDHLDNMIIRNRYINSNVQNIEFIYAEDNVVQNIDIKFESNEIHFLTNNDGIYNKSKSYNEATKYSDRDYYLFLDADCLMDMNIIKQCLDFDESKHCLIYPFKRFIYLKENIKNTISIENDISFLDDKFSKLDVNNLQEFDEGMVFIRSYGGAVLIHRDIFKKINGFCPYYKGWGYEDDDIYQRSLKLDVPNKRPSNNANLYHLHHGIHHYSRNHRVNENTHKNSYIYNKMLNMKKEEFTKYNKGWSI